MPCSSLLFASAHDVLYAYYIQNNLPSHISCKEELLDAQQTFVLRMQDLSLGPLDCDIDDMYRQTVFSASDLGRYACFAFDTIPSLLNCSIAFLGFQYLTEIFMTGSYCS